MARICSSSEISTRDVVDRFRIDHTQPSWPMNRWVADKHLNLP